MKYYLFVLDDYSIPSIASSTKEYFGTVDDFKMLVDGLDKEHYRETMNAFEQVLQGNEEATHTVCYGSVQRLALPVTLIKQKTLHFDTLKFDYKNPYGFYYFCNADETEISLYLLKGHEKYYVCYRARITNPIFRDEIVKNEFVVDEEGFWGFPNMISVNTDKEGNQIFENVLFEKEKELQTEAEAIEYFDKREKVDLTNFFEEIFGDG